MSFCRLIFVIFGKGKPRQFPNNTFFGPKIWIVGIFGRSSPILVYKRGARLRLSSQQLLLRRNKELVNFIPPHKLFPFPCSGKSILLTLNVAHTLTNFLFKSSSPLFSVPPLINYSVFSPFILFSSLTSPLAHFTYSPPFCLISFLMDVFPVCPVLFLSAPSHFCFPWFLCHSFLGTSCQSANQQILFSPWFLIFTAPFHLAFHCIPLAHHNLP